MSDISEPAPTPTTGEKEAFMQEILIRAAYYRAADWFLENVGRAPEVGEQATFVVAIVRCVQRCSDRIDVCARSDYAPG